MWNYTPMNAVTNVNSGAPASSWTSEVKQHLLHGSEDYYKVKPFYFWRDLLMSAGIAFTASAVFFVAPAFSLVQAAAFALAVFWLSRGTSLMHEISHLKQTEMTAYKAAYNLLFGVVTLTPSTFYTWLHRDHHSQQKYGTQQDPEYVPNITSTGTVRYALGYSVKILAMPVCVFMRFLLAPLTFIHPAVRNLVLTRCSSMTVHWGYVRDLKHFNARPFVAMEMLCFLRAAGIPAMLFMGLAPWERVPMMYLLAVGGIAVNQLRHLADHHYESDGGKLTLEEEVLDTANHTRNNDIFGWLLYPFAIRYHALHHLAPAIPYHNLAAAHAHLISSLPASSPYHGLEVEGWSTVAWNTLFTPRKQRKPQATAPRPAKAGSPVILQFPASPATTSSDVITPAHRRAA